MYDMNKGEEELPEDTYMQMSVRVDLFSLQSVSFSFPGSESVDKSHASSEYARFLFIQFVGCFQLVLHGCFFIFRQIFDFTIEKEEIVLLLCTCQLVLFHKIDCLRRLFLLAGFLLKMGSVQWFEHLPKIIVCLEYNEDQVCYKF
jgi:hypothetical protein